MTTLRLREFLVLISLSLLIFIGDKVGILNPAKSVASVVIMPVQYGIYSLKIGIGETFSFLTFWRSGESRIKNLEQRNLELLSSEQRAIALSKENETLRKQMGVARLSSKNLFPATVLFSGSYILIAAGSKDGIKIGQTVVLYDNFIGRVDRVNPRTSLIQLSSDPVAKIPVKIGTVRGLVLGQYNSSMSLERVAANETIQTDDVVLTSGEGDIEPNLILGKIGKIEKKESDLFQKAIVLPVVNYTDLTTVFVILD